MHAQPYAWLVKIDISRYDHPASLQDPDIWMVETERRIFNEELLRVVGDDDLAETLPDRFAAGARPRHWLIWTWFVARSQAGEVLGVALLETPERDNRHLGFLSVAVEKAHRRQGVGAALLDAAHSHARERGRTEFSTWTWTPVHPDGPLVGARHGGAVAAGLPGARLLMRRGYMLNQVERISRMELPSQEAVEAAVAPVAEGFELLTWSGPTPEDLLDELAALHVHMSTDVPHGDAGWEPETYTPERIRDDERMLEVADREQLVTAARHLGTGSLVGFTRFLADRTKPAVAHQWETLVVRAHRGHRLGVAMKSHNHARIRGHWPRVERLVTGNAEENQWMLAINHALGYRDYAAAAWWLRNDSDRPHG